MHHQPHEGPQLTSHQALRDSDGFPIPFVMEAFKIVVTPHVPHILHIQ